MNHHLDSTRTKAQNWLERKRSEPLLSTQEIKQVLDMAAAPRITHSSRVQHVRDSIVQAFYEQAWMRLAGWTSASVVAAASAVLVVQSFVYSPREKAHNPQHRSPVSTSLRMEAFIAERTKPSDELPLWEPPQTVLRKDLPQLRHAAIESSSSTFISVSCATLQ